MRIDTVWLAKRNVHVTAVGLPARFAGCEMFVRVSDAAIVLFAKLVLRRIGIRIATQPELLDEVVALLIIAQALEGFQLLVGDDPMNILIHPLLVGALQF